jgi:hypothetical protein
MRPPVSSEPMPASVTPSQDGVVDTATLELLASWRRQDATDNPEDIRQAERELADFKRAMNESRAIAGETPLYP